MSADEQAPEIDQVRRPDYRWALIERWLGLAVALASILVVVVVCVLWAMGRVQP